VFARWLVLRKQRLYGPLERIEYKAVGVPWPILRKITRDIFDLGNHLVRGVVNWGSPGCKSVFQPATNFFTHSAPTACLLQSLMKAAGESDGGLHHFSIAFSFHIGALY
jgi:hypothetical protein